MSTFLLFLNVFFPPLFCYSADKQLQVYRLKQQVVLCTRSDNTSLAQTARDFQLLYIHEIWPFSAGKVYFKCGLLQFYYHVFLLLKCKLVLMGFKLTHPIASFFPSQLLQKTFTPSSRFHVPDFSSWPLPIFHCTVEEENFSMPIKEKKKPQLTSGYSMSLFEISDLEV